MNKLILCLFMCLFSVLAQAKLQVRLQPDQVNLGDNFQLILSQESQQSSGIPDLTALQKDFVILGTERNVNYSVINGQAQSSSQWIITLRALRAGILTIPAITLGQELSTPVTINVGNGAKASSKPTPSNTDTQQEIFLTTKVSEPNPYINQQVIYTVTLYNSKRLLDAEYQGPQVENALLIPLGDVKRYQRLYNNVDYMVEEQSYAIYPQKSGPLNIVSPTFTALIYDFNPRRVKSQDKTISLNVKPIPSQFSGSDWLPAKQVSLKESYDQAAQNVTQGSTLTRTITVEGVGIPAQLLPSLDFTASDAFSVYPEKGTERNVVRQGQLVGSVVLKVTYLFNKAGKVTIPEVRLPWFNTDTGKEDVAVLAPRNFEISPSSNSGSSTTPITQQASTIKNIPSLSQEQKSDWFLQSWVAWLLAAFFGLAWLVTMGLWAWQGRRPADQNKGQYKVTLDRLRRACKEGNPEQAREALLKWASLYWPDVSILNLSDLAQLVKGAQLKKQLHLLTQVLYSNTEKTMWRGDDLWHAVEALTRGNKPKTKQKKDVLPPINPE